MYKPQIVYYHHPCSDGITSAAIVAEAYAGDESIQFIPFDYGNKRKIEEYIEECRDKQVLMVDCSFKRPDLERVAQSAENILMLDHHAGTFDDLQDFFVGAYFAAKDLEKVVSEQKVSLVFDNSHSGAGLCWAVFFTESKTPEFVRYIEHIDLGRNSFDRASAFRSWSRSLPFDIAAIRPMLSEYSTKEKLSTVFAAGDAIDQFVRTRLDQLLTNKMFLSLNGEVIPYVVTDYAFASDAANEMLRDENEDIAIAFYFTKQGLGASIRTKESIDAAAFAKAFGGNGHRRAAGFNMPYQSLGEMLEALEAQGNTLFYSEQP